MSRYDACYGSVIIIRDGYIGCITPHNATRLLRLIVTLDINLDGLDLVDEDTFTLPMDRNDITTPCSACWFVVVVEESF